MTRHRNWQKALDRKRAASAQADQWAVDAHLRAVETASIGARAKQRPNKAALREMAAKALAQFTGEIRRLPARRPK
jgi:hypothetical protein